jgi:hypothetical protein
MPNKQPCKCGFTDRCAVLCADKAMPPQPGAPKVSSAVRPGRSFTYGSWETALHALESYESSGVAMRVSFDKTGWSKTGTFRLTCRDVHQSVERVP